MEPEIITNYSFFNFELKQLDPNVKESFCITYKKREIARYIGVDSVHEINKTQIKFELDNYLPMDFLRFSMDFFNFRTKMSILFYKYTYETKQTFFFNFSVFDEYCSQIMNLIINTINDFINKLHYLSPELEIKNSDKFEVIPQKIFSLIESLYIHQRNYSTNPILNSKIHAVVASYPDFGLYYDIMKNELKLFNEENDNLSINQESASREDWAQYFGNMKTPAEWVSVETLFDVKNMKQSCRNINDIKPEKEIIKKILLEFT